MKWIRWRRVLPGPRTTSRYLPLTVCRADLRDLPNLLVQQIIRSDKDMLYGWPFVGADGKQRWITGTSPPDQPWNGSPGLRLFVESSPYWMMEADYPVDIDLWAPSFATARRGQSPEVAGPDDQGRYFVGFSTHDIKDHNGGTNFSSYGKLMLAEIGRPNSAVVVSRKQNHQVQTEPEMMILNGKLKIIYAQTQGGPFAAPGNGLVRARVLDLSDFVFPQ